MPLLRPCCRYSTLLPRYLILCSKTNLSKHLTIFLHPKRTNWAYNNPNHIGLVEMNNTKLPLSSNVRQFTVSFTTRLSGAKFFDEIEYEEVADNTLDILNEKLEIFLDQLENKSYDIVLNNGVITLSLGDKGTYVINKQTPNRQIWLSSPISGPKRYDYVDGQWVYKHDGQTLIDLLKSELEQTFNISVDLSL